MARVPRVETRNLQRQVNLPTPQPISVSGLFKGVQAAGERVAKLAQDITEIQVKNRVANIKLDIVSGFAQAKAKLSNLQDPDEILAEKDAQMAAMGDVIQSKLQGLPPFIAQDVQRDLEFRRLKFELDSQELVLKRRHEITMADLEAARDRTIRLASQAETPGERQLLMENFQAQLDETFTSGAITAEDRVEQMNIVNRGVDKQVLLQAAEANPDAFQQRFYSGEFKDMRVDDVFRALGHARERINFAEARRERQERELRDKTFDFHLNKALSGGADFDFDRFTSDWQRGIIRASQRATIERALKKFAVGDPVAGEAIDEMRAQFYVEVNDQDFEGAQQTFDALRGLPRLYDMDPKQKDELADALGELGRHLATTTTREFREMARTVNLLVKESLLGDIFARLTKEKRRQLNLELRQAFERGGISEARRVAKDIEERFEKKPSEVDLREGDTGVIQRAKESVRSK